MNVIVFGATGAVGRLVVETLLEEGHGVTAFVRDPGKLEAHHPALRRVAGNVLDQAAVTAAVADHDAAIVALGEGASRRRRVRSEGTLTVIRAMQATGVRRLICQSTLGAHESWANLNFVWKRLLFGLLLRPVIKEHDLQEKLVQASGLDWTIVRPSAFTDGPATGGFIEDVPPSRRGLKLKIAKADIAAFLARQLGETLYRHRAVGIST
jgi:uncharacterized protein YbjT (DUF2867 family)